MTINHNNNSGDSSTCSSPRISFSHDLSNNNPETNLNEEEEAAGPRRLDMSLMSRSSSSSEFNFCVSDSFQESETFPADDLFFNGVIIPIQMKQKLNSMKQEEITSTTTATIVREQKTPAKSSFWGFRRSSSLNCEKYGHKKSLSSWSMPLLFRSKSTGSCSTNDHSNKHSHKSSASNHGKFTYSNYSSSSRNNSNSNSNKSSTPSQKPPILLKKSGSGGGGSYVNGIRNGGSTLNVPPPYITKGTSDLLGFGSLFRNGSREKKMKQELKLVEKFSL